MTTTLSASPEHLPGGTLDTAILYHPSGEFSATPPTYTSDLLPDPRDPNLSITPQMLQAHFKAWSEEHIDNTNPTEFLTHFFAFQNQNPGLWNFEGQATKLRRFGNPPITALITLDNAAFSAAGDDQQARLLNILQPPKEPTPHDKQVAHTIKPQLGLPQIIIYTQGDEQETKDFADQLQKIAAETFNEWMRTNNLEAFPIGFSRQRNFNLYVVTTNDPWRGEYDRTSAERGVDGMTLNTTYGNTRADGSFDPADIRRSIMHELTHWAVDAQGAYNLATLTPEERIDQFTHAITWLNLNSTVRTPDEISGLFATEYAIAKANAIPPPEETPLERVDPSKLHILTELDKYTAEKSNRVRATRNPANNDRHTDNTGQPQPALRNRAPLPGRTHLKNHLPQLQHHLRPGTRHHPPYNHRHPLTTRRPGRHHQPLHKHPHPGHSRGTH